MLDVAAAVPVAAADPALEGLGKKKKQRANQEEISWEIDRGDEETPRGRTCKLEPLTIAADRRWRRESRSTPGAPLGFIAVSD